MLKSLKKRLSHKNRIKKYLLFKSLLRENDTILDIGVTPNVRGENDYLEKYYDITNSLTCMGLYANFSVFKQTYPAFNLIQFDGFNFPVFSKNFNWTFSNAVIEHVGDRNLQLQWLSEIRKCTDKLFITTPNRRLPYETHTMTLFYHYLPDKYRNFIYQRIGKGFFADNYMWLLSKKEFKMLLHEAGFINIRILENKFLFFTIDFVAICE